MLPARRVSVRESLMEAHSSYHFAVMARGVVGVLTGKNVFFEQPPHEVCFLFKYKPKFNQYFFRGYIFR